MALANLLIRQRERIQTMNLACQFQHLLTQPVPILPASGIDRTQPSANVATIAEAGCIARECKEARRGSRTPPQVGSSPTRAPNAAGNSICAGAGMAHGKDQLCAGQTKSNAIAPYPIGEVRSFEDCTTRPPARTSLSWAAVQLPECEYLALIVNAIERADEPDDFRVIRAAIAKVRGTVNRQSLRMMLEVREKEVAHD